MTRSEMPLGFIAFWKHTDTWYAESEAKKAEFQKELEGIFEEYKDKGIKMYGEFDCCWSSEWRYFTFWEVPNLELLEELMAKLAEIGDINMYHSQHHYVGRKVK